MRLLIKQRVFSWTDSYDIYDESGRVKYFVKAELIALGHQLHVYDCNHNEIGVIRQRIMTFLPAFDIEVNGMIRGYIQKKFTFFYPQYEIDFNGWRVEGDFLGWRYDVYQGCSAIMHIYKEFFHWGDTDAVDSENSCDGQYTLNINWGDTYVIDFANPADELMGLLLVIAIDAANCSRNN